MNDNPINMDQNRANRTQPDIRSASRVNGTDTGSGGKKRGPGRGARTALRIAKWVGIPLLLVFALMFGMQVGYSVLGDQPSSEIWDFTAIKHMINLVFGE